MFFVAPCLAASPFEERHNNARFGASHPQQQRIGLFLSRDATAEVKVESRHSPRASWHRLSNTTTHGTLGLGGVASHYVNGQTGAEE